MNWLVSFDMESIKWVWNVQQVRNDEITLKTVLRIFMWICKTVIRKPYINREDKIKIYQFSYTVIVATRTTKFLEVVTLTYFYHGLSTHNKSQEEKFTPVNMRSCGWLNDR